MAMSGVTVVDEVVKAMADVRMKRARYAILSIGNDGRNIVVKEIGPREVTYEEFYTKIASSEPCYAAFDFEYNDGTPRDKLLLIQWIPDTAKPRSKMLYSSSRDALMAVQEGFLPVQANDITELELSEILRRVKSHRLS